MTGVRRRESETVTEVVAASPVGPGTSVGRDRQYDVVVIGAGVAGLTLTLRRPAGLRVALLTKGVLGESNTRYAQGGLAAAMGADDSPALHEADTLAAGAGLCDPAAVRALVEGAPDAVRWLLDAGTAFDQDGATGTLQLGREAAHSRRRVLHAGGDATGAEIERALVARVRQDPRVEVFEHAFARDLIVEGGRCAGVVAELGVGVAPVAVRAPVVVLAAGGIGQLWAVTSNPPGATADGLAMAMRAGVAVADLEFVQFHPTVLMVPGSDAFLVSEAVRGEGAYLRAKDETRFMLADHPLAELAPRDVVARAIQRRMLADGEDHVWLDLRHLDPDVVRARFPSIGAELRRRGLDLAGDLLPVAPAAHYAMGGVVASVTGETSLPGLLALGEISCTGVHGANRLASNSLLEGLVFGLAAADRLTGEGKAPAMPPLRPGDDDGRETVSGQRHEVEAVRETIQRTMSREVAVVRDRAGLDRAIDRLRDLGGVPPAGARREVAEVANMVLAAGAIATAAATREESRGAHFRADVPALDPALDGRHLMRMGAGAGEWRFGSLADALAVGAGVSG